MATALMRVRLEALSIHGVEVASAGLLAGGTPATENACAVVPGLDNHISRQLTPELVAGADLVLGLARCHVRDVAVMDSGALARAFALKELVRRGEEVGARRPGESLGDWLAQVRVGRTNQDLLGESSADDVADPVGQLLPAYRQAADELQRLIDRLVDLIWPVSDSSAPR